MKGLKLNSIHFLVFLKTLVFLFGSFFFSNSAMIIAASALVIVVSSLISGLAVKKYFFGEKENSNLNYSLSA